MFKNCVLDLNENYISDVLYNQYVPQTIFLKIDVAGKGLLRLICTLTKSDKIRNDCDIKGRVRTT